MKRMLRPTQTLALAALCGWACAQGVAPAAAASVAATKAGPPPDLRVVEDDQVRIEETRSRGQLQRITVHTRLGGARSYEIIVGSPGRDPSQERGAAGQRAWSLFTF